MDEVFLVYRNDGNPISIYSNFNSALKMVLTCYNIDIAANDRKYKKLAGNLKHEMPETAIRKLNARLKELTNEYEKLRLEKMMYEDGEITYLSYIEKQYLPANATYKIEKFNIED